MPERNAYTPFDPWEQRPIVANAEQDAAGVSTREYATLRLPIVHRDRCAVIKERPATEYTPPFDLGIGACDKYLECETNSNQKASAH
ncbi:hypothetical protein HRbin20_01606 [bacterium HR20]|nr:hypothetical protein HRbin20_01606 [bacterium HR20]